MSNAIVLQIYYYHSYLIYDFIEVTLPLIIHL